MSVLTVTVMEHKSSSVKDSPQVNVRRPRSKRRMSSFRRTDSPSLVSESGAGPTARVKRFHSKSRRGCMTCRQRRVKCDEQRTPNCARCDKGGYICEWQDSRASRSLGSEDRLSPNVTRSSSRAPQLSEDEGSSHRFFTEGIVANICSLFTDMTESFISDETKSLSVSKSIANFYYQFAYQASFSSTIIRKTLSALCGLHERAYSTSRGSSPSPLSHDHINQYSEALSNLRTSSRELSSDIVLIASILFANCEYLMGDLCSAMRHLRAGAKILDEQTTFADGKLPADLCDTLKSIFEAFDHNAIELEGSSPGSDHYEILQEQQFKDISQANEELLQIYNHAFALQKVARSNPHHVSSTISDFRRWSNIWKSRTGTLEESSDTSLAMWLQLLHAQHTALESVIEDMAVPNGILAIHENLDDIILQLSTFLQNHSDIQMHHRPFEESVGLILPLFLVVTRCGNVETCEAALSILLRLNTVEGVWSSCCAYAAGRTVLDARQAMRLERGETPSIFTDSLPPAEITKAVALNTGTEFDITISFPQQQHLLAPDESNAIVGGFCGTEPSDSAKICTILDTSGYQGPVVSHASTDCSCHRS